MLKAKVVSALSWAVFVCSIAAGPMLVAAESIPVKPSYPPPVQPASQEAELALKRFRVAKGLQVELVAAEPLLANPVAFTIDERGRFYVVETFRLHAGVTDIRGHMDWLDEELAVKTVEERVAYVTKHEGKHIDDYKRFSDRLRLVWDSDGDGCADQATVFADGFNGVADGLAAGVLARAGDVYFANIPNLWLLRDSKNAGAADVKKSLSYGYGVRVGFIGHDLHGLRFGPDGKLYFSIGDRGAYVKAKDGKVVENRETGAVYRCDPDGSNLEIFASGLRNPQELAFDQFGNLWTGDNNSDGGDPARWVYVVEGGDSGWRIGWQFINSPNARGLWLAERLCYPQFDGQAAYILPPIANIGNGPSGLTYYPGTGLNERFKDRFFLCDFRGGTGSGIHSIGVKPKGAGFEVTERADFIWDVLVTDGDFGYDGCFYLTDWVNGWNQTGKGRIYRVFDPQTRISPLVQHVKSLFADGFDQRADAELSNLLAHPDQRVRQEAQFALAGKGAAAIETLVDVLRHGPPSSLTPGSIPVTQLQPRLARLHAVWGLGQIANRKTKAVNHQAGDALVAFLADADPEVRAQAAKVLGDARASRAYDGLTFLLRDPEPRARFFAAIALSKLGRPEAFHAVIEMLRANDNKDVYLRHAGVMALASLAGARTLERLASDKSLAVRMAAVVALRRQERAEVGTFFKDTEPTIVLEAARAINDLPIASALPKLASLIDDKTLLARQEEASRKQRDAVAAQKNPRKPQPDQEPDVLCSPLLRRILNAQFRVGAASNASALIAFATGANAPSALRAEAVTVLADWAKPLGRDNVTGLWRPLDKRDAAIASKAIEKNIDALLQNPSTAVKLAAIKVATKLGIKEGTDAAFALLADDRQPANVRIEALKSLSILKAAKLADAVKLALAASDESLRNEATRIQAHLKPADATAKLKATLEKGSTGEKQAAFATLAALPSSAADEILGQWLDKLLAKQVPTELQLDLLDAAAKRQSRDVKDKVARFERARSADDDLRAWRECLAGGSAEEGRKIFLERADVSCVRCHRAGGEGGEVGPDLSHIAASKPREYLLEAIVYPNKQIAVGFENLLVTMNNGTVYAGLVKSETADELELNSPEDGLLKLKKSEIKSREHGLSAMPEELRQVLSKQDLRDLVEFLAGLK
jgi:quinoprotein glucose dehydrogenase